MIRKKICCMGLVLLFAAPAAAQDADTSPAAPQVIVEGSGDVNVGGQPAARKGDVTDKGQPIVQGSENVFINGRPVATVGDKTACDGVSISGAPNVFVNGKPVARSGDVTTGCSDK